MNATYTRHAYINQPMDGIKMELLFRSSVHDMWYLHACMVLHPSNRSLDILPKRPLHMHSLPNQIPNLFSLYSLHRLFILSQLVDRSRSHPNTLWLNPETQDPEERSRR